MGVRSILLLPILSYVFLAHSKPTVNVAMSYELLILNLVGGGSQLFKRHKYNNTFRSFRAFLFLWASHPSSDTVSTLFRTSYKQVFPNELATGSPPDATMESRRDREMIGEEPTRDEHRARDVVRLNQFQVIGEKYADATTVATNHVQHFWDQ
ncbi:hypothetical protein PAAG_04087 [Paracoccidioides lutzii Pb01]|uniref:Uncharacterized protein n=1 Tax=Paracoccidioides lutzii (strain ATCC MYA-826 / Pb01) TaxID=502779 RepID=C1GZZ3_PARBA|nr:hypothetical protein PAAG_04087 [Paracoccidioides lutzii Pb01]EEH33034.2 hypothetical protein PAAG_04087 [Paracoccidioides lutzii Pb01]